MLFFGLGEAVYELELPYISLPKFREPIMPADWTRLGPSACRQRPQWKGEARARRRHPSRLTKDLADQIRRDAALSHGGVDLGTRKRHGGARAITTICSETITIAAGASRRAAGPAKAPSD